MGNNRGLLDRLHWLHRLRWGGSGLGWGGGLGLGGRGLGGLRLAAKGRGRQEGSNQEKTRRVAGRGRQGGEGGEGGQGGMCEGAEEERRVAGKAAC